MFPLVRRRVLCGSFACKCMIAWSTKTVVAVFPPRSTEHMVDAHTTFGIQNHEAGGHELNILIAVRPLHQGFTSVLFGRIHKWSFQTSVFNFSSSSEIHCPVNQDLPVFVHTSDYKYLILTMDHSEIRFLFLKKSQGLLITWRYTRFRM